VPAVHGAGVDRRTLKPSPFWMQRRLSLCGCRPISNIVDHYELRDAGVRPAACTRSTTRCWRTTKSSSRRARAGEKMATLDGIGPPITPEELLIADGHRPVAIAG